MTDFLHSVSDLWASLSSELLIFLLTLFFALAISGPTRKQAAKKPIKTQLNQKVQAPKQPDDAACGPPPPSQETQKRPPRHPAGLANGRPRGAPLQGSPGREPQRAYKAGQIMDMVVESIREQPPARFAMTALDKYAEFKALLDEDGMLAGQVERNSRVSALDFYEALVLCTTRAARCHLVEPLIDDMVRYGVGRTLHFYESAMKQLAGQKQYHFALRINDRLATDGLQPTAVTCSCLVSFAAEVGEFERAIDFFNKLAAHTTPSIRAYMTVLRVFGKLQDWDSSVSTLRDMQSRGVAIDSFVLNVILATGIAAGEISGVEALAAEMSSYKPALLDIVSYNILVKGNAQRNDYEGVLKVAERMRSSGLTPNAITFNSMMDAAVRTQRSDEVWDLLAEMRCAGFRPDKYTCSILVKSLAQNPAPHRVQSTMEVLIEVNDAGDSTLRRFLYHALFEAASQAGLPSLLKRVFSQMREYKVMPTVAMVRRLKEMQASKPDADPANNPGMGAKLVGS